MVFGRAIVLCTLSLTLAGVAKAETPPTTVAPQPVSVNDGIRRDPKGKQGVSPFWEALRRGDEAAVARDYTKAKQAYQEAATQEPKRALAHYRIGQVEVLAGKLAEAETAYNDALRFADSEPTLRAQLLFVLADLKERQEQRDAALKAWQAYADYLKSEPRAKGYPATAEERQKRLIRYSEILVECKGIKERIALRMKELEAKAAGKAK